MKSLDKQHVTNMEHKCNKVTDKQDWEKLGSNEHLAEIMKSLDKQDWEKEFDDKCWDTDEGVMTEVTILRNGNFFGKLTEKVTKKMIKSFIQSELNRQLDEILGLECWWRKKVKTKYNKASKLRELDVSKFTAFKMGFEAGKVSGFLTLRHQIKEQIKSLKSK